ncbi:uncharacterized protein LOC126672218 [Mercurialis annua]|uniref:uncharacterized protein LOC126672218 n=1 Tax=Mercurialis annua TaxID=3986 RepID=UPI002160242B|nr:uncharacterized protein LOC126672218 [Mercurialis annua]
MPFIDPKVAFLYRKGPRLSISQLHLGEVGIPTISSVLGRRTDEPLLGSNSSFLCLRTKVVSVVGGGTDVKKVVGGGKDSRKMIRLSASLIVFIFLLRQGIAFRGHDELIDSNNHNNNLEILKFWCDHNEDIKKAADKCPGNLKLTSPKIQKDIVHVYVIESTYIIFQDLRGKLFSILVDEVRDVSVKEQMSVCSMFCRQSGQVIERILGIVHVPDTTALLLKLLIEDLFLRYNLSISRLRGQGYDRASNMQGEYNGLNALVFKKNKSAFYIHCFARQLQWALVDIAKKYVSIEVLFTMTNSVVNIVIGSCKRHNILMKYQAMSILKRSNILGVSNKLSLALQRKDQDIVNAMNLVEIGKIWLQSMREHGWSSFLDEVFMFCANHDVDIINMDAIYVVRRRSRCNAGKVVFLENQLETYIMDVKLSEEFKNLYGTSALAMNLVSTRRHIVYTLVYKLITLTLILPISTATVERVFSAMEIVKT